MSSCVATIPARPISRSFAVAYATLTAITFSAASAAPTPIYRLYREALGLTPFAITFIFAVYSFTMIAAFLTVARLSDHVGRKPMIASALGLNALALLLFFVAQSAAALILARALQGVATGIALATLGAVIADTAPKASGDVEQRDGVHRTGARRADLGRARRLCAVADARRLCAVARRDARRDGRPGLDRRNRVAKGRRLERRSGPS